MIIKITLIIIIILTIKIIIMIKKINNIYNDFINDIFSTANKEIQHQKKNLSYININNNETSN